MGWATFRLRTPPRSSPRTLRACEGWGSALGLLPLHGPPSSGGGSHETRPLWRASEGPVRTFRGRGRSRVLRRPGSPPLPLIHPLLRHLSGSQARSGASRREGSGSAPGGSGGRTGPRRRGPQALWPPLSPGEGPLEALERLAGVLVSSPFSPEWTVMKDAVEPR